MVGTSLVFQWIRLFVLNAGGMDSIPGQETKILHAHGTAKQTNKIGGNTSNHVTALF